MRFNDFITKLKMRFLESKGEVLSLNFDDMILSEGDAAKAIEHGDLQINDNDLIVDSDFLLSSNIAVAEKYKIVEEFARNNNVRHLKMTEAGAISHAAINSGFLKEDKIYASASCKVVAPYFENDFIVLPSDSRVFQIGDSIDMIFIKVSTDLLADADPERLAFKVIEKIDELNLKQMRLGSSFALLDQESYKTLDFAQRVRFFSILNSVNLLGFESADFEISRHACTGISKKLEVHELLIENLDDVCLKFDKVVPENSIIAEEIDRVFLGGCAGGDFETLKEIAELTKGKTLRKNLELIVTPSDFAAYKKASESGVLTELSKAGFTIAAPSCASCKGNHSGILAKDEKVLSMFPLAEPGRMGDPSAEVYRCSVKNILKKIMQ